MRVRWTSPAARDLARIGDYIAEHDTGAAKRVVERIWRRASDLAAAPLMGRRGRVENTRELVVGRYPYIVVYRIAGETVEIVAVLHTSRQWPDSFS